MVIFLDSRYNAHAFDKHTAKAFPVVRIKEVIREQGFTYESLGDAVGLTKTSIARIASGDQTPSFTTLKKIASTLDIDIRELFEPTKEEANEEETLYVLRDGQYQPIGKLLK